MKTLFSVAALCSVVFIVGVSSVHSQGLGGYTVVSSPSGPQVCLGRWMPSRDVALPGVCEGQLVDIAQFTALHTKMSTDRLDQVVLLLGLIDQKLAVNNDQISRLLDTAAKTQTSIEQQGGHADELLRETISRRFDALPEEILGSVQFREELMKLKEDILREVESRYPARSAPARK